ncbi:hypothetical protein EMCRGX_G013639 [Ephydatia muelleri]
MSSRNRTRCPKCCKKLSYSAYKRHQNPLYCPPGTSSEEASQSILIDHDGPDDGSDSFQTEGKDISDVRNYDHGESEEEEVIQKISDEWSGSVSSDKESDLENHEQENEAQVVDNIDDIDQEMCVQPISTDMMPDDVSHYESASRSMYNSTNALSTTNHNVNVAGEKSYGSLSSLVLQPLAIGLVFFQLVYKVSDRGIEFVLKQQFICGGRSSEKEKRNMGRCEDCKCFIIRCFRGERCKSCSRALQAKEMAELNAPFVLPGEEIRVPLKATRPTDTRAASDIFEAWGLSEDHIQIFGQPQSACIVEASAADSSGTNYFEANFDVFRTLPPAEDDLLAMQDKECSLAPRNDACTCTNLDGDMLSRNTLRTCEWSLQGYKALSWENLAPQASTSKRLSMKWRSLTELHVKTFHTMDGPQKSVTSDDT